MSDTHEGQTSPKAALQARRRALRRELAQVDRAIEQAAKQLRAIEGRLARAAAQAA